MVVMAIFGPKTCASKSVLTLVLLHVAMVSTLDNGLVRVPWMGWSAWQVFRATTPAEDPEHSLTEKLIRDTADALVDKGFAAAGYNIVWVDDAWASKERDASGALVADPLRWPHGMKAVADYVHSKGLLFGLYGDIGTTTCAGYPGLQRPNGDFSQDAMQLASWGVDAFKVDGCNADPLTMDATYPALGKALNATGRKMIYSCSWPDYERSSSEAVNFSLVAETCNSWRIFWDVQAGQYAKTQQQRFDCVSGYLEFAATGSTEKAAQFAPSCPGDWNAHHHPASLDYSAMLNAARPGSFNDGDMLPIGLDYVMEGGNMVNIQAFTPIQARSAMALWVVLASPLMIGADVRSIDDDGRSVWLNRGLLKAHQDPLGKQGVRIRGNSTARQVWKRELVNNNVLVVLYNNVMGSPTNTTPPTWVGPFKSIYSDDDCVNLGNEPLKTVTECKTLCEATTTCDALNYGGRGCVLRGCLSQNLTTPSWNDPGDQSYRMTKVPPNPTMLNSTMTVTMAELGLSSSDSFQVTELINDEDLGVRKTSINVTLRFGESAALLLAPATKMN
eukprot:m.33018 g.33018  ORF g.33018 m.33018 type:complete len:559 (-) comp16742_c0_seq1:85-1761(-)